jgi:hypothetical protein
MTMFAQIIHLPAGVIGPGPKEYASDCGLYRLI